jgi:hypothetical protein
VFGEKVGRARGVEVRQIPMNGQHNAVARIGAAKHTHHRNRTNYGRRRHKTQGSAKYPNQREFNKSVQEGEQHSREQHSREMERARKKEKKKRGVH